MTLSGKTPLSAKLGLKGLPTLTDSLVSGGLYMLIAETASARFPVLSVSLADGLSVGMACRLVLPQNPEPLIERLQSFGNLNIEQAIRDHQLELFTVQDEFSKKIFRYGAGAFVQELEQYGFADGSYVVFDQADDLLALHDVLMALEQVEILKNWACAHKITFLLVLTRLSGAQSDTINALMDRLSGIVRLAADRHGLNLTFDYWQSNEGTIAGRSFSLTQASSGLYQVVDGAASSEESRGKADIAGAKQVEPADAHVFFMDPDLGTLAKQMPGKWQRIDTLVSMLHATRSLPSATCILLFQKDSQLRQLAETVHTLRTGLGRYAQIVVQEKDASLRYQNEALLLKLGLNLVINRDVPMSRFPLLLQSLRGQIFNRDVDINFEVALASVLPTQLRGYLLPARFVQEVMAVIERAQTLEVPCALVLGRPTPGRAMQDVLAASRISRPGDLITASDKEYVVFLSACPESVLLKTVERLLGASLDEVFSQVRFAINKAEMVVELAALTRAIERGSLPNYSSVMDLVEAAVPVDRPAEGAVGFVDPNVLAAPEPVLRPEPRSTTSAFDPPAVDEVLFSYDEVPDNLVFGKNQAPRATRAKVRN